MEHAPDPAARIPAPPEALSEPDFVVETVLTGELYRRFNRLHLKVTDVGRFPFILGIVMSAISLFVLFSNRLTGERNLLASAVMIQIFALLLIAGARLIPRAFVRAASKPVLNGTEQRRLDRPFTLWLYADRLIEYSPRGQLVTYYEELYKVVESDELILLYINKTQAHILDKSGFCKGTPEALVAHLTGTCRLPYKRVK